MYKFILIAAFVAYASAAPVSPDDAHAEVINQKLHVGPEGFVSLLDTTNTIHQEASGDEHGNIHGVIDWISPEGVKVGITFVADENGYQPTGDLIPTPHPIPAAILKSIAYNAAHPQKEESHK